MIKELFINKVDREIETVVKADDERNIDSEINEYVITQEISRRIGPLFSEYGSSTVINGVWIHGYFGSGKSHLLKMLSYVFSGAKLKNGSGKTAAEVFAEKAKDEMLKADILKTSRIPSESILFNIDQQVSDSAKERGNSVLSVFYKVFYDHLGFYGTQPHIAEFEWWLQFRKNIYPEFKEKFAKQTGKEWTEARRDYYDLDVTDAISAVLGELLERDESDYEDILEEIEEKSHLSIEDFASRVADYVNTKPENFQLNFFIDEVGQFIAGDVNLMLNLQTITESLSTATKNKSWVFATAQSAIEGLGEDLKRTQDYSKILGRFRTQINLTSANVDEVIEKRLLEKKEEVIPELKELYTKEKPLINTLIFSSEKGMPITAYKDKDDFVRKYPFLFYQFSLFQECRKTLANHEIFQGKHQSVGERSMLGVFQDILKAIQDDNTPVIVSFDRMYDGLSNAIRSEFTGSINNARNNLGDKFADRVLKVLFLVKYYKQFLATKENIAMLLIDDIHIDIKEHKEKVNKALTVLENRSYIERNGELYEFLTSKEKDIETEIKNTEIEESKVNQKLKELFFEEVLGRYNRRIPYRDNKQEYEFTQKLDGGIFGREKELAVEIITPNNEAIEDLENLKAQTMGVPMLRLVTEPDNEFMEDVRMSLKIERYNSLNQSTANSNEVRSILFQKLSDNNRRKESLKNRADSMLGRAKAYVNGSRLEVTPRTSGQTYVLDCFQDLIKIFYPNLRMLGQTSFTEDTFRNIIRGFNEPGLFDSGDASVSEAENQILTLINRRRNQSERTSVYDLKNEFGKRPFGWYENAVFSLLAKLYKKNKIEISIGENPLNDSQLIDALLNSSQHTRAYVANQTVYTSGQIAALKDLFRDLFDQNTTYNDAKDVAVDFREKLKGLANDVRELLMQKSDFPFVNELDSFSENLNNWKNKNYKEIIENVSELEDLLLDDKEDKYDPIKSFIKGSQAEVYKNITQTVKGQTANLDYVEGTEFEELKEFLGNDKPYLGQALQNAEVRRKSLQEKVLSLIDKERNLTLEKFEEALKDLEMHPEMKKLDPKDYERLTETIRRKFKDVPKQRFIGNLRDERRGLPSLVEVALNRASEINTPATSKNNGQSTNGVEEPKAIKYVNQTQINVPYDKRELITEEDVNEYVEELRETFLKQIKENKRIRL